MRTAVILLAAFSLCAQSSLTPDLQALTKIRVRMAYNLQHQPNYTCVETIERSSRAKLANKLKIVDTLRLEVALVNGREMFAWPGSKRFDDDDVTKMITTGAIGNGNFSTHAAAIFTTQSATFHYIGQVDLDGKKAVQFDYDVPQMLSGYSIRVSQAKAIVAYHGSFYADPSTYDIRRIEVIADDLPLSLNLTSTSDKIDYAVTRIGESDFLLPAQSELSMINLQGGEEHNHVKFVSCREFSGESVITFGEAPKDALEPAATPTREFDLPEGLEIRLVITKEIDLRTAAIGDPVVARVDRDVKQEHEIVIPKGATATGRITRFERHDNSIVLGVEFPDIEAPGILAHMKGSLTNILGPIAPRVRSTREAPLRPGEGRIPMVPSQTHLARGCIMYWRT